MRVLFLIPKHKAPELEGEFSKLFKEFVSLCLNKNPDHVCYVGVCGMLCGECACVMCGVCMWNVCMWLWDVMCEYLRLISVF